MATVFDQLVAKADRTPIPTKVPGKALNGEDIRAAMQDKLNLGLFWPKASQAIKNAIDGDASDLATVNDKTLDFVQAQTHACVDKPRAATGYTEFAQLARMAKQLSPHLGGAVLGWRTVAACQGWPVAANVPAPKQLPLPAHADRPVHPSVLDPVRVGLQPVRHDPPQRRAFPRRR